MPARSKSQFRLMKAAENNPDFAKKMGISPMAAGEFTEGNVKSKKYFKLPEKKLKRGGCCW